MLRETRGPIKKTRTDKSEVALQPNDPIQPVRLGAHSRDLSTGVGYQLCSYPFNFINIILFMEDQEKTVDSSLILVRHFLPKTLVEGRSAPRPDRPHIKIH